MTESRPSRIALDSVPFKETKAKLEKALSSPDFQQSLKSALAGELTSKSSTPTQRDGGASTANLPMNNSERKE
jgi:hypothetical protein